jgi:bZIP transcription factor
MQTRKRAMQEFTFSFPTTPGLEIQTSASPQPPTMVQPSMLHLPTPESFVSSEPSTPSYLDPLDTEQPKKKQRTRRNAKTEEEKVARAEERAVRNRRAAQESRDRKKKLYDVLELENERLRAENKHLRERMQRLEERFAGVEDMEVKEVKLEVEGGEGDELARTHPAVVLSLDQQCRAGLVSPPSQISSCNRISTSFCRNPSPRYPSLSTPLSTSPTTKTFNTTKTSNTTKMTPPNTPTYTRNSSPTTSTRSPECQKTFSPQMESLTDLLFDSCATFDSLNMGSLDRGAEMTTEASLGEVSMADESFLLTGADAGNLVSDYTCYGIGNGLEGWDSKLIHGNINPFY